MNSAIRKLANLILVGVLVVGSAYAQEGDGLIETYNSAIANLEAVLEAGAEQGAAAFELLARSSNQLLALSLDSASESLTASLEQVLARAQIAVQNQSQTDLVVQTAVLRGGFQRIVYDSALSAATDGNFDLARARLGELITDLNLPETTATAVAEATTTDALRFAMEAGISNVVAQGLDVANNLSATDPAQAYQILAASYGTFLLVQDSPRAQTDMNQRFIDAANALVADEPEAEVVTGALTDLGDDFTVLESAALTGQPEVQQRPSIEGTPDEGTPIDEGVEPAVLPSSETNPEVETAPATTETPVEVAPTTTATTTDPVDPVATTTVTDGGEAEAGTPTELTLEQLEALLAEQQRTEAIDRVRAEIVAYGVANGPATLHAERLVDAGFGNVGEVLDGLYAIGARAAVAAEVGDEAAAKGLIGDFSTNYQQQLAPIVRITDADLHGQTERMTASLLDGLALRLQDVVGLVGHVGAMSDALSGRQVSGTHNAIVTTSLFWNGLVRLIFVIVFGLLAFVPLYLLNLAFGGGNRNWQLVGVALFLLLLPIIYEAVAFIGNVVADLSGNDVFNAVASFSIFQNTIAQVVWAVVTAAAILFAIAGLYGICVQFGLLGRKGAAAPTGDTRETNVRASAVEPADSLVDWDEEF
jgi:hypothetical protein